MLQHTGRFMSAARRRLTAREYPDHHSMYIHRRILVPVCPASRPYFVAWNPQETTDVYTLDQHGVTRYDLSSDALPSPAEVEVSPQQMF